MSVFRAKLWTGVGAAVLLSAGGLAACSGEGEAGERADAPAAGAASAAVPAGEGGEGGGEGGGPVGGEAGGRQAYASTPAESHTALRLAHLKGFFMAAQSVDQKQGSDEAAALAGQGLLEIFDPAAAELRALSLDEAVLRRAAQTGDSADLAAATVKIEEAMARAGGDQRAVAKGLSSLAAGLYREAVTGGAVDPIEYQHASAAVLSLWSMEARPELLPAQREIDRLSKFFPSSVGPKEVAEAPKLAEVQAQASRVELALSGA